MMHPSIKVRRAGFTLLELLIVVVILIILIGLLLPALASMRRSAQMAEVTKNISDLETALEQFKTEYGVYPPSRITLYKDLAGWNSDVRSKTIIKKLWNKFDFTSDGAGGSFPFPSGKSFVTLDGAECLLFFLGGVRDADGVYIGFSNNKAQPFTLTGGSRVGPFFRFEADRLVDTDSDSLFEYLDTLPEQTKPYIYLSGYNGQGYDALDLSVDGTSGGAKRMTSYYTQSGTTGWNPKKFQIISAGIDGEYGAGGAYDPDNAGTALVGGRKHERDNVTNFASGTLAN